MEERMSAGRAETSVRALPVLLTTEEAFCAWLGRAQPGDRVGYYRGSLTTDRLRSLGAIEQNSRRVSALASRAYALANQGRILLFQERHEDGDYTYWAVARGQGPGGKS
jgi:hypothetical protein